jgi:hypothetical protein
MWNLEKRWFHWGNLDFFGKNFSLTGRLISIEMDCVVVEVAGGPRTGAFYVREVVLQPRFTF